MGMNMPMTGSCTVRALYAIDELSKLQRDQSCLASG
jgi:hypothetical protein